MADPPVRAAPITGRSQFTSGLAHEFNSTPKSLYGSNELVTASARRIHSPSKRSMIGGRFSDHHTLRVLRIVFRTRCARENQVRKKLIAFLAHERLQRIRALKYLAKCIAGYSLRVG